MKASMWIMLEILLIGAILLYSTVRTNTIIDVVFLHKSCLRWGGGRKGKKQDIHQALQWAFFLTLFCRGCTWSVVPSPALGDALLVQCIKNFPGTPTEVRAKHQSVMQPVNPN